MSPPSRAEAAAAALLLLAAVLVLEARSAALHGALWADPDAPAHFVSGLLVRDYLLHALGHDPLAYARVYYAHYPKVAIGNWPPVFYALQGVWMAVLPARPTSVLFLVATLAAAAAWVVFLTLRRDVGPVVALFGALVSLTLWPSPVVAGELMADSAMALAAMLALLFWVRFLDAPERPDAVGFTLCAAAAALTKGNGLCLALVPPLSILIGRRWRLLRSRLLWLAAAAIVVLSAPWTLAFLDIVRAGWSNLRPSLGYSAHAIVFYLGVLYRSAGVALLLLAFVGITAALRRRRDRRGRGGSALAVAATSLVLAVVLFHAAIPTGAASRYMLLALPGVAILAAIGSDVVASLLAARGVGRRWAEVGVVAVAAAAFLAQAFRLPAKRGANYDSAAELVLGTAARDAPSVSLVSSDALGEGAYVAAVAVRDPARPRDVVWRGTKLLATVGWAGRDYTLLATDDRGVLERLERAGVRAVVLDRSVVAFPHQRLLEETIRRHPERFRLLGRVRVVRPEAGSPAEADVYRFLPSGSPPAGPPLVQRPGATHAIR